MSVDIIALVNRYRECFAYNTTTLRALTELLKELKEGGKNDYLGTLYRTNFTVAGRGAFPVDMLRYSNAWPADETSARDIEESVEKDGNNAYTIRLTKYHRDPTPQLAYERWESKFRWTVIRAATETVEL